MKRQQVWVGDLYIGTFDVPEDLFLGKIYADEVVLPVERDGADLFTMFRDALLVAGCVEAPPDDDCLWWAGHEPAWLLQSKLEAEIRKNPKQEPFAVAVWWLQTYSRGGFDLSYRERKDPQWADLLHRMIRGDTLEMRDFQCLEAATRFSAAWWLELYHRKPQGLAGDPAGVDVTAHGVDRADTLKVGAS